MASDQAITPAAVNVAESPRDSIPEVNSVFEQPWWLDCVAAGSWDASVVRRDDEVVARLPYMVRRRYGLTTIVQPQLTQTLGPWLAPTTAKYAKRLETEKRLLGQLIEGLPPFDFFRLSFAPTLTNWLPFYWAGFEANVRCTYRIEDLSDLDRVQSEFQGEIRRGVRKAQESLEVDHDFALDGLLRLNAQTFTRQGLRTPYTDAFLRRLDAACAARGSRRIIAAVDARGRVHAALYVVWDERALYALVNARDTAVQVLGANALVYWEAIRLASEVSRVFDFEGSMLEPIEHFVREFGGRQTPYLCVSKASPKARAALAARSAGEALGGLVRRRVRRRAAP